MADSDESLEEKTEEASQHRRDEWKKEGRVSQSREVTGAVMLFFTTLVFYFSSGWMFGGMGWMFEDMLSDLSRSVDADWTVAKMTAISEYLFSGFGRIFAPIAAVTVIVGILGSISQTGIVWSTKPLELNPGKLNPIKGLKRIFGMEGLFELAKALVKFLVVGTIAVVMLRGWVGEASGFWTLDPNQFGPAFAPYVLRILLTVALAMMAIAALDYAFQRFRYEQQIKMTKQEAKEERKKVEGDPQIKARVRQIQRQMAMQRMIDDVRKADVVVTNPTHIAIALVYDRENMLAPRVVAKGADHMAQKIKKIAREAGVPCVENVQLARALFKAMKIGQVIKKEFFNAVAEVLAYVYRVNGKGRQL